MTGRSNAGYHSEIYFLLGMRFPSNHLLHNFAGERGQRDKPIDFGISSVTPFMNWAYYPPLQRAWQSVFCYETLEDNPEGFCHGTFT